MAKAKSKLKYFVTFEDGQLVNTTEHPTYKAAETAARKYLLDEVYNGSEPDPVCITVVVAIVEVDLNPTITVIKV